LPQSVSSKLIFRNSFACNTSKDQIRGGVFDLYQTAPPTPFCMSQATRPFAQRLLMLSTLQRPDIGYFIGANVNLLIPAAEG
jgi:hypothetical protein